VVAALLAVIGYSLNDTIVLFDRIRENFPRLRKASPLQVVNTSVNETLSRTLMTSLTTLLVLVALFIFGGEIIHAFAFTLIVACWWEPTRRSMSPARPCWNWASASSTCWRWKKKARR